MFNGGRINKGGLGIGGGLAVVARRITGDFVLYLLGLDLFLRFFSGDFVLSLLLFFFLLSSFSCLAGECSWLRGSLRSMGLLFSGGFFLDATLGHAG